MTSVLADKNSAISGEITGSVEFCREKWILIRNSDISEKAAYLFAFLLSSYIILGYVEKRIHKIVIIAKKKLIKYEQYRSRKSVQ